MQAWLQDFAWMEADFDEKLRARAAGHDPEVQETLLKAPLFCFERAVRPFNQKSSFEQSCGLLLP